jgi:hypothetical protein
MKPPVYIAIGVAIVLLVQSATSHQPQSASPKSDPVVLAPAQPTREPLAERLDDCDAEPVIWEGDEVVWSPDHCEDAIYDYYQQKHEQEMEDRIRRDSRGTQDEGDPGAHDVAEGPHGMDP